jgi:hypothetical protein
MKVLQVNLDSQRFHENISNIKNKLNKTDEVGK